MAHGCEHALAGSAGGRIVRVVRAIAVARAGAEAGSAVGRQIAVRAGLRAAVVVLLAPDEDVLALPRPRALGDVSDVAAERADLSVAGVPAVVLVAGSRRVGR